MKELHPNSDRVTRQSDFRRSGDISLRVLLIFLMVVLLTSAQLTWWIAFQVMQTGREIESAEQRSRRDCAIATHWIGSRAEEEGFSAVLVQEILEAGFPELSWDGEAASEGEIAKFVDRGRVRVDPGWIESLRDRRRGRIRMFVSEGLVFLAVLVLGVLMIYRTLKREVTLQRQQANFLAAVTHELKSPLASIRLMTETLGRLKLTEEKRREYQNSILIDVERLGSLVDNILSVSRIESRGGETVKESAELLREIQASRDALHESFAEKKVRLELKLPEEELMVRGAPESLQTIIRNLLENAAKYGGPEARIQLALTRSNGRAVLEVKDRGLGLSREDCKRVFDKFYRVGDEMVRQVPGSGLGLYLVKALVIECGGEVSAESDGIGRGTTFRVSLPLVQGDAA